MNNDFYRKLIEELPIGFAYHKILCNEDGIPCDYEFIEVNSAFEIYTGLKASQIIGKKISDILPNIYDRAFDSIKVYGEIAMSGKSIEFEQYFEALNKCYRISVSSPEKYYFITLLIDITKEAIEITKQKKYKEELMNKTEELDRFFYVNLDLLCIADTDGNFIKVNKSWESILGYTKDYLEGRKFFDFIHPDDIEPTLKVVSKLKEQEQVLNYVNRYKCYDGTYKYIEWRSHPYGKFIYAAARDITEKIKDENDMKNNLDMREKHLELMKLNGLKVGEFLDCTLNYVISFTRSSIGYIFTYDEEKEEYNLHSWSDNVLEGCKVKDQSMLYSFGKVGLWGEVVRQRKPIIVNDYQTLNVMKKGYPQGHISIKNFISIPVFNDGKIVAVVGAANKETDYDDEDILNLNLLMNTVWSAVERIKTEKLLIEERELFETTLFSINEGIIVTDISGKITLMNKLAEQYTGWSTDEACGEDFYKIFNNINIQTRVKGENPVLEVIEKGSSINSSQYVGLVSKDGSEVYISFKASRIDSNAGSMTGVVVSFSDITKEYQQEKEIEIFLNMNIDMLCVADTDGNFHKVNKKFEEILGYKADEVEGKSFISFVHEEDIQASLETIKELVDKKSVSGFTNRYRCKDGSYKYIEWYIQLGIGKFTYSSARDVTEKRMLEEQLRKIAIRDELTGVYNRYFFDKIIQEQMERSDQYNEPISMVMLDLDHFKLVNDTWGHPVGDEMLKLTARITESTIRSSDFLVRFGGEEFVVLMPKTSMLGAISAAEKIRETIEKNNHPVTGKQTVSMGVAERMKYESFKNWYRRVDIALYRAKHGGRNCVVASDQNESSSVATLCVDWRDEWESGNKEIDRQHHELFEIANSLINISLDIGYDEKVHKMELLLQHIIHHFNYEEKVLAAVEYPELITHAIVHKNLAAKGLQLKESYKNGEIKSTAFLSFFIDDILLGHLVEVDVEFFPYTRINK